MLSTNDFCCIGCSNLKLRYLSEWVGLWQTADNKWRFDERLINKTKNGRHSYFSCSIVSCTKLSTVFTRVKNSGQVCFFNDHKCISTYLFHRRGGSAKVSKARFSTSSMTRFTTTDETGEPITVPKTCLQCFRRKVKFVELKQNSSPWFSSVVDKFVRWLRSGLDRRRCLTVLNADWIGTFVNKDTSNETIASSVWSNSWARDHAKSEKFLTWCFNFPISVLSSDDNSLANPLAGESVKKNIGRRGMLFSFYNFGSSYNRVLWHLSFSV